MKSTALIMSDWSISRMLAGKKTQTSRLRGLEAVNAQADKVTELQRMDDGTYFFSPIMKYIKCPWCVGQQIWVKETWRIGEFRQFRNLYKIKIFYKADGAFRWVYVSPEIFESLKMAYRNSQWRSPLFMPRWAARPELCRTVTGIKAQRVGNITEEECIAEGISKYEGIEEGGRGWKEAAFRELWNFFHAKPKPVHRNSKWAKILDWYDPELKEIHRRFADTLGGENVRSYDLPNEIVGYISFPFAEEDGDHRVKIRDKSHFRCVNPWVWMLSFS